MAGWRVSSSKMWSLGEFRPETELVRNKYGTYAGPEYALGREFRTWMHDRVNSLGVCTVRSPEHHDSIHWDLTNKATDRSDVPWHHDGISIDNHTYLVVWSNSKTTQVRNGVHIYEPAPYEVLLFDNLAFEHRRPRVRSLKIAESRWFIRASLNHRINVRDVPGVYKYLT